MRAAALTTGRLHLRVLAPGDRTLFRELYGDAETMRYIGRPKSRAEIDASFRATLRVLHRPGKPQFLTIVKRRGNEAIGVCSIRRISWRRRSAEVGIMLVRPALRQGYGAEALGALVSRAFGALPLDVIWAQYHGANEAIARLIESLGFVTANGRRPRGAKRRQCVGIMRRHLWRKPSDQLGDYSMSNIVGFLENAGRDAAKRYATREQLLQMMQGEEVEPAALIDRSVLGSLLGVRETMYCGTLGEKTPKPGKKAPKKKAPAKKTPAKKKPAKKKPAKKAPPKKK